MAPRVGIEPTTNGLTVRRSTAELPGKLGWSPNRRARILGHRAGRVKEYASIFFMRLRRAAQGNLGYACAGTLAGPVHCAPGDRSAATTGQSRECDPRHRPGTNSAGRFPAGGTIGAP